MIELDEVAYSYGGGELLTDLSLRLAPGSFHFLTGPSGAGKTTFLKLCYGALVPTGGQVRLFNQDVRELDRDGIAYARRRIGVVHQDCQFLDHLPVAENISLPLAVSGQDRLAAQANLKELMSWVGLAHRAQALPPELSGGERQSVAIARAVHFGAKVLILDEPTSALGVKEAEIVLRYVRRARARGIAVIFISHNVHHAFPIGDSFTILRRGQVSMTCSKGDLSKGELVTEMAGGEELQSFESDSDDEFDLEAVTEETKY